MAQDNPPGRINYKGLTDPLEIRVLVLKKTTGNDPTCLLQHIYLAGRENQPPINKQGDIRTYHALSYEWGEKRHGRDITVDSIYVRIHRNLYEALKQIRSEQKDDLCLWIDALCINQEDLEEKSQQVGMMGKIFRNAEGVIAWLGVASDDSEKAMDLMADHNNMRQVLMGSHIDDPMPQAIVKLCHRSYWRRVWIIQELYLARNHVVRCGTKAIPRAEFEDSLAVTHDTDLPWTWKEMENSPADQHRRARERRDYAIQGAKFNKLRRWMTMCIDSDFQASNERDYIYALVGISDDCKDGQIVPNYEKRPADVLLEAISTKSFGWFRVNNNRGSDRDYKRAIALAEKMGLHLDLRNSIKKNFGVKISEPAESDSDVSDASIEPDSD